MELNNTQKEKLQKVSDFLEKTEVSQLLPFADLLEEIRDTLKLIADKERTEMKVQKVEFMGAEVVTIKGKDGQDPTDQHLVELITPLIPEPVAGKDYVLTESDKKEIAGKITVPIVEKEIETIIEKQSIITNEIKEVAIADTAEVIIGKINELPIETDEFKIEKEHIKGLSDIIDRLENRISNIPRGGGGRKGGMEVHDLSSQTNGSLKIFTVPKSRTGFIISSDFPTVLTINNGFMLNAMTTQLTLTPDNAPSTKSQLIYVYSSLFNI